MLHAHRSTEKSSRSEVHQETYIPVILKIDSHDAILPEYINEMHRRGNLVLATISDDDLDALFQNQHILRVEACQSAIPQMDVARTYCNLYKIDNSTDTSLGLTGKGVVVGLFDVGVDFNHINFKDKEGRLRIKRWISHQNNLPLPVSIDDQQAILSAGTDNAPDFHGTHTMGILAGLSAGLPYNGVASEADIVVATGQLYDAYILNGCEEIIDYAKNVSKPVVISLSISNYLGAHDGTSLFNQYVNLLSKEAPIFMASGNENPRMGAICGFQFNDMPFRTYLVSNNNPNLINGNVDLWFDEPATPVIKIIRYNKSSGKIEKEYIVNNASEKEGEWIYVSPDLIDDYPWCESDNLPSDFSGYIYVASEISPENDKRNIIFRVNINPTENSILSSDTAFGIEISSENSSKMDVFSDGGIYLRNFTDAQAINGSPDGCVTSMSIGSDAICVGAFCDRDKFPLLNGTVIDSYFRPADVPASFSSYGTNLPSGMNLPHFIAPGCQIISSISTPFLNFNPEYISNNCNAITTVDGENYYYIASCGTSMATPYVAGVAALMLEANQNLTVSDIRESMLSSVTAPTSDISNPQWGSGLLDCEAAMQKVFQYSGIQPNLFTDNDCNIHFDHRNKQIHISSNGRATLRITNILGSMVMSENPHPNALIDVSFLPNGVYIANLTSETGVKDILKFVIK